MTETRRRLHLDWLRIGATFVVVIYHCSRPFDTEWWHIKDVHQSEAITRTAGFASLWIMPFFFVLSGMSTRFALHTKGSGQILRERVWRLLVPFVFGVLVIVPPQVYVERRLGRSLEGNLPAFEGSYLEFYPHYFDGLYAFGGNFSWIGHHLWYLLLLFVVTLLTLPWAAGLVRSPSMEAPARFRGAALAGVVLLAVIEIAVHGTPLAVRALGGWTPVAYPAFFFLGLIMAGPKWEAALVRDAPIAALVSLAALAVLLIGVPGPGTAALLARTLARDVASWAGILALIGSSARALATTTRGLRILGPLVMPTYVLHQTVIILVAYPLLDYALRPELKFGVLVITMGVVVVPLAMAVARAPRLGWLFGNPASLSRVACGR